MVSYFLENKTLFIGKALLMQYLESIMQSDEQFGMNVIHKPTLGFTRLLLNHLELI